MATEKRFQITITGKVQGVFFRHSAKRKADELGISGFVRNMPESSVYIEAEGEEKVLQEFIAWCRKGPELARVDHVTIEESPLVNEKGFSIKE